MDKIIRYFLIVITAILVTNCGSADIQKGTEENPVAHKAGIVLQEFVYTEADFPQSHSATILELEEGELLCAFFGGTRERNPDVEIRLARKKPGGNWTAPRSVADGVQPDGERFPTWNPVLFQNSLGEVMLFYKVGPSPSEWWGMVKTSQDGGHTWSEGERLPGNILGPVKNKPIQLEDGTIVSGSSTEGEDGWQVHIERSTDNGESWNYIGPINDADKIGAIQPTLLKHSDDRIQLLARTRSEVKSIGESWSEDGGLSWSEMETSSLPNNNSGLDGVTLEDGRHILVYNHSTRQQPGMGHKGRGVLNVAVSEDGQNWEAALVLEYLDEQGRQFSYPAVIQTEDGLVHIVYTWHRERIKHVVLDPEKLETYPIENGEWPSDEIPLMPSDQE